MAEIGAAAAALRPRRTFKYPVLADACKGLKSAEIAGRAREIEPF
jgi:hypothetical protein